MNAVERFEEIASQSEFKGWPLAGSPVLGHKIPFFGQVLEYQLDTPTGRELYYSILRYFGWAVVFGVKREHPDTNFGSYVVTLCQWKPGVNQAIWELPPGGIGKIAPDTALHEIMNKTQEIYLRETGYGKGLWKYLGHIMIETGKYRGAGPEDHGLPAHLFLANNIQKIQNARQLRPNEIIETLMVPLDEFPEVMESGLFNEESAVACAYKALLHLKILRWA